MRVGGSMCEGGWVNVWSGWMYQCVRVGGSMRGVGGCINA